MYVYRFGVCLTNISIITRIKYVSLINITSQSFEIHHNVHNKLKIVLVMVYNDCKKIY